MIELLIAGSTLGIAFLVSVFLVPGYIRKARLVGFTDKVWRYHKPDIPNGGIVFTIGFLSGVLFHVFLKTFYLRTPESIVFIFALTTSVLLAALLGFADDLLGEHRPKRLKKLLFTVPIGIPLMVVNAGESVMFIPLLGNVSLGIIYPLLVVPLIVIIAANVFGSLSGFSGLEAGLGVIILSAMGFVSWYVNGMEWLALVSFIGVSSLLGFLVFNWNPSRILPGSSLTLATGALIGMIAILGNMERLGFILLLPFFLAALMRIFLRDKQGVEFKGEGSVDVSGARRMEHLAIMIIKNLKKKCSETNVTLFFYLLEFLLVLIVFVFFV